MAMKIVTVNLPEKIVAYIDLLVDQGIYHSRCDFFRVSTLNYLPHIQEEIMKVETYLKEKERNIPVLECREERIDAIVNKEVIPSYVPKLFRDMVCELIIGHLAEQNKPLRYIDLEGLVGFSKPVIVNRIAKINNTYPTLVKKVKFKKTKSMHYILNRELLNSLTKTEEVCVK